MERQVSLFDTPMDTQAANISRVREKIGGAVPNAERSITK